MTSVQKVISLFLDNEPENSDQTNPIVVLGSEYSPEIAKDLSISGDTVLVDNTGSVSEKHGLFQTGGIANFLQRPATPGVPWPTDFLADVRTRLWFTYRVGFPVILKDKNSPNTILGAIVRGNFADFNTNGFTTDCGWGCMIRTSQSLLANALLHLHLSREWRYEDSDGAGSEYVTASDGTSAAITHSKIVSWFQDTPTAPFSIHKFVQKGTQLCGKSSGEWFGPSAASTSIHALCSEFSQANLDVYVSDNGDVYQGDLVWSQKSLLLLLGIRLGIDNINEVYYEGVKQALSLPHSVGIAGGRPSSSHYFFGFQNDSLFFLDPHVSNKKALVPDGAGNLDLGSTHTESFNKLHLSEMDPSMLIGFLIKDESDFEHFKKLIESKNLNNIVRVYPGSKQDLAKFSGHSIEDFTELDDGFIDLGANSDNESVDHWEEVKQVKRSASASYEDLQGAYSLESKRESQVIVEDDFKS